MILKTLDYRKDENCAEVYEEWNYFDNIKSASTYFDNEIKLPVVCCSFHGGNRVTIAIPNVAYLMSDAGKTIEKIIPADVEELGDTQQAAYNTLQEAVDEAKEG